MKKEKEGNQNKAMKKITKYNNWLKRLVEIYFFKTL